MEALANEYVLAGVVSLVTGLLLYAFLIPRNIDTLGSIGDGDKSSALLRVLGVLGTELYASMPRGTNFHRKPNPRIESLITRSGNPWNLTAQQFIFMRIVTAFVGFILGWVIWFASMSVADLPWFLLVPGATVFGYLYPGSVYRDQVKKRDLEFKRQLPDALDLITISLTGGATFTESIRNSIPNMEDGVLKTEFKDIVSSVDTGRTLDEALTRFAKRAPNESIETFVSSVREANELDTPLADVLSSRAQASREDFFALVHAKTASLSSMIMAVLTPTLIPAMLIIAVAPSIASIYASFGG